MLIYFNGHFVDCNLWCCWSELVNDERYSWTTIFEYLQKSLIGFKSGLWAGCSRPFTESSMSHSCNVFIQGHCPVGRSTFDLIWGPECSEPGFHRGYLSTFLCSTFPQPWAISMSLLLKTSPQLDAATTKFHCWDGTGQGMNAAWFPPDMTLRTEVKNLKPLSP